MEYTLEETILSVQGLNVSYADKKVLHDINFEVRNITRPSTGEPQGQIIAIIGRSGSGKSTLFKAISGFHKLSPENGCTGSVRIGKDLHDVRMGEVGVVPQDYPLLNHRTIYDNFEIALRGVSDKEKKRTIEEYSDYFNLLEQLPKFPCDLSGGQRQRAAILQQILAGNTFILLDEPFSGLDVLIKEKVTELLIKASNITEENTLVIVSHDIESACAISDHVFVLGNDSQNEGSTILKSYNFLEMGLAYQKNIRERKEFREVIKEIKTIM